MTTGFGKKRPEEEGRFTVTDPSWSQRVADAMSRLGDEFEKGELAYLALTSKVENPIRDRLAYSLQRRFGEEGNIYVAREWTEQIRRVDIAVLDGRIPRLLLEIKAMYNSYNLFRKNQAGFPNQVGKDIDKLRSYQSKDKLEKIAMILVPNHTDRCSRDLENIVKYRLWNHQPRHKDDLKKAIESNFPPKRCGSGCIFGGRAFGIGVDVHYWLFGPY